MADYLERPECDFSMVSHHVGEVSRVTPADRQRARTKQELFEIIRSNIWKSNLSNQVKRETTLAARKLFEWRFTK